MTKEENELVIKDICGRLPYGVFVDENIERLDKDPVIYMYDYHPFIDRCKPYLRPMSSMTVEERKELETLGWRVDELADNAPWAHCGAIHHVVDGIDFLNRHMFDYRGLILMGLAAPAPDGMYNIQNIN